MIMKERTFQPTLIDFDQSLKGICFLLTGVLLFSLQDVFIKWISNGYPVHEILFVRSLTAIGPILLIAGVEGGLQLLSPRHLPLHLLRAGLIFVAYTSYYLAMAALPLAETVSLFFTAPLFITLLSIHTLGEKVGWTIWIALIAGFFGVLCIARPGSGILDPAALLPLLSAVSYAFLVILTRRLGREASGASLAFYPTLVFLLVTGCIGLIWGWSGLGDPTHPSLQFLTRAWSIPDLRDLALMIACGLIAAMGFYCLFQAYRLARTSTVTPFEYAYVPLGCLWGAVFWQEVPSIWSVVGMIFIVVSGIHLAIGHRLMKRSRVGGSWTRPGV